MPPPPNVALYNKSHTWYRTKSPVESLTNCLAKTEVAQLLVHHLHLTQLYQFLAYISSVQWLGVCGCYLFGGSGMFIARPCLDEGGTWRWGHTPKVLSSLKPLHADMLPHVTCATSRKGVALSWFDLASWLAYVRSMFSGVVVGDVMFSKEMCESKGWSVRQRDFAEGRGTHSVSALLLVCHFLWSSFLDVSICFSQPRDSDQREHLPSNFNLACQPCVLFSETKNLCLLKNSWYFAAHLRQVYPPCWRFAWKLGHTWSAVRSGVDSKIHQTVFDLSWIVTQNNEFTWDSIVSAEKWHSKLLWSDKVEGP